ncbi:hypothetical protein [Pseudoalteromonas luteoviolacea]|uniref:hypothetical protein n=1 Tax=Pseudoalteromonas luteoviolacea TaxID=43657 RepID=UPI0011549127|nr:hypothetical protein [Pseudoalteromonas luteoviolacea]TQF70214.1 hypothetical protein FLM44_03740 [Pseudoalteromonas luteoviolacea]
MSISFNIIYVVILVCEVAFWVLLFSGFAVRYLIGRKKLSAYMLASVPLVDLLLLVFVAMDLTQGASATFAHGLACAYIGFTVAFGPSLISWADQWFAQKFGGVDSQADEVFGWSAVIEELKLWFRCILAVVITYALLVLIVGFVNDASKTEALHIWFKMPLFTIFFWFLFGPFWRIIFFKRAPKI